MSTSPELLHHLPRNPSDEALLDGFLAFVEAQGLELYPAQEEAILEVFAGNNVILNTPTGSGKSLVALAGHFAALARHQRSFYTAPIKALVSEKFFALCRDLGSEQVGMLPGDASVNPGAPVICCTAEILANMALRDGSAADVDHVCVDEFHFYADRDRGWAWQVPLLELERSVFLLMSATLGPTDRFEADLSKRTGRPTVLVRSTDWPVPLDFEYRGTPLHETITELVETGRTPVYIVHFTQKDATQQAQHLTSLDVLTREEKDAVKEGVGDFRFDSPFGQDLRRFVAAGIGVHHAGMLPRYRLLVEKLAQQGRLKLVCGTDTLGVGVNVPIRTVLFTQLCKYDGQRVRLLSVREFQQIAGRAGRKGYDSRGSVWVQAPPHVVENRRAEEQAAEPRKRRKVVKKRPPERGYAHWDETRMWKLVEGEPEPLDSSFAVSHMMLLHLLDRPGDGCAATRQLLTDNHEPRARQRNHIRRAIAVYRSLAGAGVVEVLDEPDEDGRLVRVNLDLQAEFSLNQPLSPFVVDAVIELDREDPDYALDVLSVVEAVLEDPMVVVLAQLDRLKGELVAQLKAERVEYEQRMEELEKLTWPQPRGDWLRDTFELWRVHHPWVGSETIRPKSIARELWERAMTFREYVGHYGLKRSEGVLLRHLSDAYKGLVQNVPEPAKTDEVYDLTEWLGALVRSVDSSLLDEWERLRQPDPASAGEEVRSRLDPTATHGFAVMVRNEAFRWATLVARRDWPTLAELPRTGGGRWRPSELEAAAEDYFTEHGEVRLDADARSAAHLVVVRRADEWLVTQILADPDDTREWRVEGRIDLEASREANGPVVELSAVRRL